MEFINIIKYNYGMTTKQAKNYIKETKQNGLFEKIKNELVKGYKQQATEIFYND